MKNRMIELERFIAACIIVLYHLGILEASWIFVEFFFILAGWFMMQHLHSRSEEIEAKGMWYPLQYTFRKYQKIFPYTGAAILIMWFVHADWWDLPLEGIVKWLLYLPGELLLLGGTGMLPYGLTFFESITTPRMIHVHLWYVASMLAVMPVVFTLLANKKQYRALLCSVVPALLYGLLIMRDGTVNDWHSEKYGFLFCNIRAAAGLLTGCGAWYASQWWRGRQYTRLGKWALTALEVGSFVLVAGISAVSTAPYDCLEIGLLALSVSLTASGVTHTARLRFKAFETLGSWSLAIYCLHLPVIHFCSGWFGYADLPVFLCIIAAGALFTLIVSKAGRALNLHKSVTRLFVESGSGAAAGK